MTSLTDREAKFLNNWHSLGIKEALSIRIIDVVDSTMEAAREWIKEGLTSPLAMVLADQQTAGRGRKGRQWLSEHKGLYITLLCRSPKDSNALQGLSLASGVIILRALKQFNQSAFKLKWPNDILNVEGKKVSGTLIEVVPGSPSWILIGTGINIETPKSSDIASGLLEFVDSGIDTDQLALTLAEEYYNGLPIFFKSGFAAFKEEWLNNAYNLGQEVKVNDGPKSQVGIFKSLADDGTLMLETSDGITPVSVGDVMAL